MKRKIGVLTTTALLSGISVLLLTACGGEYIKETGNVSGGAVSGAAVEKATIEQKESTDVETRRYPTFHTDTNVYYEIYEEDDTKLVNCRLDGTKKEIIKIKDFYEIITVADGYLYYQIYSEEDDEDGLWRMPLKKDKDGYDVVVKDNAEKIIEDYNGMDAIYVGKEFILYNTYRDTLQKVDLQTKEKSIVEAPVDLKESIDIWWEGVGNRLIFESDGDGIFVQEIGEKIWIKIIDITETYYPAYIYDEDFFFFVKDYELNEIQDIERFDFQKKTKDTFVTADEILKAVKEAEGVQETQLDVCKMTDMFYEGDRLYIQVQVNWEVQDKYHVAYAVFSKGEKESDLRYEKELTECMRSHRTVKTGKWIADNYSGLSRGMPDDYEKKEKVMKENVIVNDAMCFAITNGKAFLRCDGYEKKKQRIGCYELNTGNFKWLTKDDIGFYEAYCSEHSYSNFYLDMESGTYDLVEQDITWRTTITEKMPFNQFVEGEGEKK